MGGSGDSVKADVHQLVPSTLRGHREEMDTAAETQLLDIAPADVLQNLGQ